MGISPRADVHVLEGFLGKQIEINNLGSDFSGAGIVKLVIKYLN